jgi:hydroxypyruvate reductase
MARAVENILKDRITDGVIAVPEVMEQSLSKVRLIDAGHPLPDEGSIEAGKCIASILENTKEQDLVLVLISGGGSALLELPVGGLELSDLQRVNDLLIKSGAPIQEINTIRKQLSMIKGGGLGALAAPARTAALILSDVVGDPLEAIASGPTVECDDSIHVVWEILERYDLSSRIPQSVKRVLDHQSEASKPCSKSYLEVNNVIIGSNRIAAEAARETAQKLGFQTILLTTILQGDAKMMGFLIAHLVKALKRLDHKGRPRCMLLGGETTVVVRGEGMGGRNQELALAAAMELAGFQHVALMTLATDGIDGPTPSAGAIITGGTIERAKELGMDPNAYLKNNDSHSFFKALGDTLDFGLTGTNVNDLILICEYPDLSAN